MDRVAFTRNTLRDFVSHFAFGIVDDNIIVCNQKGVGNFTLCRETFARARSAEDEAVGIFEPLSINHNQNYWKVHSDRSTSSLCRTGKAPVW